MDIVSHAFYNSVYSDLVDNSSGESSFSSPPHSFSDHHQPVYHQYPDSAQYSSVLKNKDIISSMHPVPYFSPTLPLASKLVNIECLAS